MHTQIKPGIKFTPLPEDARQRLFAALQDNAAKGSSLLMDRKTTSFVGTRAAGEEVPDDEVINAIRSVPCHY